ncbi:MAG: hypothetical protein COA88_12995 [Kordia sp.]|nr:MAG: hypothetical protein COA88_12995 [Kordia sp.]
MNKEKFSKLYNSLQENKRNNVRITLVREVSSVVIVVSVLLWAFSVHRNTVDKIKVTDQSGNVISTKTIRKKKLITSLIKAHCAKSIYYANSFDRMTIKENQAKTFFLINQKSAKKVFETYLNNSNYNDAIQRGYNFEAKFLKIKDFDTSVEPYKVKFYSELTIEQGTITQKYIIVSTGEIITHTPQYPENPYGYYFKNYSQRFKNVN